MFKLHSEYKPTGDQPQAIEYLSKGIEEGKKFQTLLGVTGSGKTFTMANIIQKVQKPTLVLAHNKTLAGQLYSEFKEFFPENNVEYFVSYYDYYQPEAYIPSSDTYIEKDSSVNDEIDKLRHSATAALFETRDVIIVASVSCIYGLGDPIDYEHMTVSLRPGMKIERDAMLKKLINMQYSRNELDFKRGTFRAKGDIVEIFPSDYGESAIRVEFWGDEVEKISEINPLTGKTVASRNHIMIFPNSHYVTTSDKMEHAITTIEEEMKQQVEYFKSQGKLIEAQRIEERTNFDIEMMRETGFCSGIENYSRHLAGLFEETAVLLGNPKKVANWFMVEVLRLMKEKGILSRFGIVLLILLALVLILPSARIDLASSIEASTQASVRVEHIQNFARSAEMDVQLLSADDPAYQQIANVLSGLTCVKRFNQQYSSYSHEYPVDSVTVSYYDDAENNNLLFTVYSDGTAIVNSQFVKIKEPKGGAEEVYQKLAEIVK